MTQNAIEVKRPKVLTTETPIVCLCGSTKFKYEYRIVNRFMTIRGIAVLSVGGFHHSENYELTNQEKENVDELHKRKIDIADFIFVIDVDSYVGDSTKSEIEYGKANNVPIFYLSDEPQIFKPEIIKGIEDNRFEL